MNFEELIEIEERLLRPVQLEPDSLLWHYTDTQGLEGIVAKREFRLGHPGFLNDPSELQYANNIYDDMLSRLSGDPDIPVQKFVNGYRDFEADFRRRYGKTVNPTPFVASFCEDRDNLDLWRQYGDDGRGFALGFRMEVLQNVLARKDEQMKMPRDVYVYRVLYDRKKQENITTCILETWRRKYLKKPPENAEGDRELYLALFQTFEFYTPLLKHPCYVSEKECRLVLDGVSIDEDEINYLPRRGYFKPFIDLSIDNRNQQFPLHTVVVGPATNPSRCERSLRMFLNNHLPERTDIQICRSALPYLGRT